MSDEGGATVGATPAGSADAAAVAGRLRTWTIATTNGPVVSGYLPDWAEDDPSESGVPVAGLSARLDDVWHRAPRVPVVNLLIVDDYWITDLDPNGLAEVAARLRAQADRLDREVGPALVAAREDWAAHHTA
jgi:hypothetical protein